MPRSPAPSPALIHQALDGAELAQEVEFEHAGEALGGDLRAALGLALGGGAVHPAGREPLEVFRGGLATAIGRLAQSERAALLIRFLRDGPYPGPGRWLKAAAGNALRDPETAAVIRFVFGRIIPEFQGFVAEALAAGAVTRWMEGMRAAGGLDPGVRLYLGDAVLARNSRGQRAKAADMHVLSVEPGSAGRVTVHAVVEVKSYGKSFAGAATQFRTHLARARRGLYFGEEFVPGRRVRVAREVHRILVRPSTWLLPRTFRYPETETGHRLEVDPGVPPTAGDTVIPRGPRGTEVLLRWSEEALAELAYDMSWWFFGRVGEAVWAEGHPPWLEMSPYDAGRNAVKQMLHYAIHRMRTANDWEKAVALYNVYGFGYALGSSYRDRRGVRQMLWPSDLEELLAAGVTREGCGVKGVRRRRQ